MGSSPEAIATLTAPTVLQPDTVLHASPHSIGLRGRRLAQSPLTLYPIVLGAGAFGWSTDDRGAAEIIDKFIDLGGNFVDATGSYVDGRSERAVGAWLARPGSRSRILLGTTIGYHHTFAEGSARLVVHAVEAALTRLGTDHLDLLSVHLGEDSPTVEVLVAVDDLIRSGKVRFVSASAPSANRLIEARIVAAQHGVSPLVAVQANYSLVHRAGYESGVARVVALQDCGFMPRQPLAGGLLSERYRSMQEAARRVRRGAEVTLPPKRWPSLLSGLASIARELGVGVSGAALAWLLTRPGVTAPIVSASSADQIVEAMSAVRVQLTRHQLAELDRLSR